MLEAYRKHVEERAAVGIVPKPLDAQQVAELVKLVETPPAGEEAAVLDLLENRIPPGVDEAAYVKAAFLDAVANGTVKSPICLLYTSPSPRDPKTSRMPSSA